MTTIGLCKHFIIELESYKYQKCEMSNCEEYFEGNVSQVSPHDSLPAFIRRVAKSRWDLEAELPDL